MKDIAVVGSIALDTVETPNGRRDNALGGSCTYFSIASSRFTKTRIVGITGTDFPPQAMELLKRFEIDLEGLETVEGKTFRWGGRYKSNMNRRDTIFTELNVFENFKPVLPETYRDAEILFLGNIHPELQLDVLGQMQNKPLVALDTMNLWIDISRDKLLDVIRKTDIIIINEDEIRQLNGTSSIFTAARRTMELGPKTLIIKKGENGAILYHDDRQFIIPAYPIENVVDPTGAGDTFAGGFMGYLGTCDLKNLTMRDYKMAMVYGTVMGSFLVESFSTDRLETVGDDEIAARAEKLMDMICV